MRKIIIAWVIGLVILALFMNGANAQEDCTTFSPPEGTTEIFSPGDYDIVIMETEGGSVEFLDVTAGQLLVSDSPIITVHKCFLSEEEPSLTPTPTPPPPEEPTSTPVPTVTPPPEVTLTPTVTPKVTPTVTPPPPEVTVTPSVPPTPPPELPKTGGGDSMPTLIVSALGLGFLGAGLIAAEKKYG